MQTTIRFGVFEVDLRAGQLRKQGVRVKLQEQPLQVLLFLSENACRNRPHSHFPGPSLASMIVNVTKFPRIDAHQSNVFLVANQPVNTIYWGFIFAPVVF